MKSQLWMLAMLASVLLFHSACVSHPSGEPKEPHWGYAGNEGPERWAELDPAWERCGSGLNQSPVNLADFVESELAPIAFRYTPGATNILNNGHTIQVNYAPGSTITADGHTFDLKQYHFHAPSENTLEGQSFPMEAHFVHADREGHLAVVAVFYEEGAANPLLGRLWEKMPQRSGDEQNLAADVAADPLLPKERDYFYFNGSLTTPPCSEGVHWFVMKAPATVSAVQVAAFERVMHHANNRPVQPLNARRVLQ